ncbi:MAG: 4Fe-4S dicluster domain-containing protein [Crenarchaeota archaeon]|nr:4Fe-4S dicluster domain-containing protein [Thermoproteota archaeon]
MVSEIPSYRRSGVISVEELRRLGLLPPEDRLRKGPVAILECPEMIPCNICVSACPSGAIRMDRIIDVPRVDWDKCVGCGNCVAICPGLAAFVVDLSKPGKAYVTLPHELLPRPREGEEVTLLSRDGREVGKGRVVRVWERNRTLVVTVEVPEELAMEVRAIWVRR